tara:strand:+ start:664 stop:867 length:204 start_codon:yes stop_codon:yes gene_type:complete
MTLDQKIHHADEIANAIQLREPTYPFPSPDGFKYVSLPTPQVVGTMTQQRSYAMGKAMDIIANITEK